MKFVIEAASRTNVNDLGLDQYRIDLLKRKGIEIRRVSISDDDEEYINTVDIFYLPDLLTILKTMGKCVINLNNGSDTLPIITIYDDWIE